MIEITSSILKEDEFKDTVDTLISASEVDHEEKFREHTLEYINDTSDSNDDMFFFDMLEFTRFLVPGKGDNDSHIAYTDPNGLIYLNCPNGIVPKDYRIWEFIYDHECLHQLWETFDVAEQIKKDGLEYNHQMLNIASDCVINDYLKRIRGKKPFEKGIFPEVLKEKFDVDYDPKKDTQYSLYVKLLEKKDEIEKDKDIMDQANDHENSGESNQQQSSNQDKKDGKDSGQGDDQENKDKKDGKDGGQDGDQENKDQKDGQGSGQGDGQENKDKKDGQDSGKGNDSKDKKDGQDNEEENAKQGEKDPTGGEKGNDEKQGGTNKWGRGQGSNEEQTEADLEEIRRKIKDIKDKYRSKLTSDLGKFIEKCQSSAKGERNGLITKTMNKGLSGWDVEMQKVVNNYVKKKIFQKHKQYEPTYKRPRRGYAVKSGEPLKPDRRIKEDKFVINFAFYVDKSGSMTGIIDNVFNAAYKICESIKKKHGKDKVVSGTEFKIYAFDDYIYPIKYGNRCEASAGNMDFGELSEHIVKLTNDYLVNVIITDAQFSVNESMASKFIEKLNGILVFIINNKELAFKKLAKKYNTKMYYIEADPNFEINI